MNAEQQMMPVNCTGSDTYIGSRQNSCTNIYIYTHVQTW